MVHADLKEYEDKLPPSMLKEIEETCPAGKIKKVAKKVYEEYMSAKIDAGESVGLVGAASIGEPGTQMTLNTFHYAGVAEMNVTMGLPRIIEILDGRKSIATPQMEIFLKAPYNKGKDIKQIALEIKETKLGEIVLEYSLNIVDLKIELKLDSEKMKELELTGAVIAKAVEKGLSSEASVKYDDGVITLKLKGKEEEKGLNALYRL